MYIKKSHTNITNIFAMSMAIYYASNYSSIFLLKASITQKKKKKEKKKKERKKEGQCIGCFM